MAADTLVELDIHLFWAPVLPKFPMYIPARRIREMHNGK